MIKIAKILKVKYEGLDAPESVKDIVNSLCKTSQENFNVSFTSGNYQSEDGNTKSFFVNSEVIDFAVRSNQYDRVYVLSILIKSPELQEQFNLMIEKYITDAYSIDELIAKAQASLTNSDTTWLSTLMTGSFTGTQITNEKIVALLHQGLHNSSSEVRVNTCWISYYNELYWDVVHPVLQKLQLEDQDDFVRYNASAVIECMLPEQDEGV